MRGAPSWLKIVPLAVGKSRIARHRDLVGNAAQSEPSIDHARIDRAVTRR